MMNWLKYYPVKLRLAKKIESPEYVDLTHVKEQECTLLGSRLSFKAPRHRPQSSTIQGSSSLRKFEILSQGPMSFIDGLMSNDNWEYIPLFNRYWAFYGSWFSGVQTELHYSFTVIIKPEHQQGVSYFHPRAFENAIADYLNTKYGFKAYGGEPSWSGPLNWKPVDYLPVFGVVFEIIPTKNNENSGNQSFFFPVSDKHIVEVSMKHVYSAMGTIEERKAKFDSRPMEKLANDIINSIRLELSPEIQAQWDRVKAECPDMSLVKDFAPLKWPTSEAKIEVEPEQNNLLLDSDSLDLDSDIYLENDDK